MSSSIEPWSPPSPDVWKVMQDQAKLLASSSIVPQAFRGQPANILTAIMTGQELGLGPTTALNYINVIQGKATLSAEAMVALSRRAGHSIQGETSAEGATVTGKRGDTGDEMKVSFTIDDAQRAGLGGQNWKKYPAAMCWARAVSQLCRMLFPDVLMGVSYMPEELGGDPDPVDLGPETVDVVTGEITVEPAPEPDPVEQVAVEAEVIDNPYDTQELTAGTLKVRRGKFAQAVAEWAKENGYEGDVTELRHAIIERATGKNSSKNVLVEAEWDAIRDVFKQVTAGELPPAELTGDSDANQ